METTLLVVIGAWFLGGFISGVSGIGGAMFAVPVAAIFIPIQEVIALSCILNLAMDGVLAVMHLRFCRVKALWPMLVGAIPGSVAGLFVLQMVPSRWLQAGVGGILLFFLYWQQRVSKIRKGKESWGLGSVAGFSSGVLGTAISFDGPPIGVYGLYASWQPRIYLGTLGVFFILRGSFTCILQASSGFYTPNVIDYALWGFPATMLGTLCAFPIAKRIDQKTFAKVLSGVIMVAACVCLYKAIC